MIRLLVLLALLVGCAAPAAPVWRLGADYAGGPTPSGAIRQAFGAPVKARDGEEGDVLTLVSGEWIAQAPTSGAGDIEGVTAGDDLDGGGTSGTVELDVTSTLATVTARGNVATAGVGLNGVTPAAGHLALGSSTSVVSSASMIVRVADNSTGFGHVFEEQWGSLTAGASSTTIFGDGFWEFYAVTSTDASSTQNGNATGAFLRQTSGAATGNDAITFPAAQASIVSAALPYAVFKFALPATTSVRMFVGLGNSPTAAFVAADDNDQACVGLQFSTDRDATQFYWYRDDDAAVNPTAVATGIAVDTSVHYVVIDFTSSTTCRVSLLDAAGATQDSREFTTHVPTIVVNPFMGIETRADEARSFDFYWVKVGLRP